MPPASWWPAAGTCPWRSRSRPGGCADGRLGELTTGRLGVEAVFALSYRALGPDRRQLFRMLGVHPGNDVTAASAAALAAVDPTEAERALESLLDEHLLEQAMPGRYQLHDLLRAYAATLSRTEDPVDER